jgi:hypothetical protein
MSWPDQNTLANTKYSEEVYYWQGMVSAAQGDTQDALSKFSDTLRFNRNFFPAQEAKAQVEAGTFQIPTRGSALDCTPDLPRPGGRKVRYVLSACR